MTTPTPRQRLTGALALLVLVALTAGAAVLITSIRKDDPKHARSVFDQLPPISASAPSSVAHASTGTPSRTPIPFRSAAPTFPAKPPPTSPAPQPYPIETPAGPQPSLPPGVRLTENTNGDRFLVYEVVSGDTLTSIAQRFDTTVQALYFWSRGNLGPDPNQIYPGDLVVIGKVS